MVSTDVVGIGSDYFVVNFRVYIYVRLIMPGYLFFCIYFNVWCMTLFRSLNLAFFISRRCHAVYDLRRQAPTTTTTRIPDPRTYLPPAGCPTSFFYPKREKKFSAFFVTPTLPAPCCVVASARLCCLACASGRLSFAVGERYY